MADLETYLKALADGTTAELPEPTSALGVYLKAIIDGNTDVPEPTSVLGAYLYTIAKNGGMGGNTGGGGGSSDSGVLDSLIDRSITEISSNVTSVGSYGFNSCTSLVTVELPLATSIGASAFGTCNSLTAVDFPLVKSIGSNAFSYCSALTTVNLPLVTNIEDYSFHQSKSITTINFPSATRVGQNAFTLGQMEMVDFPLVNSINNYAFSNCSKLKSVILRNETVATLSNKNAFSGTPIASGTGYIYVPRALLSDTDATKDYRQATNWSTYASKFRALEDYTVDGTITGELDESKI